VIDQQVALAWTEGQLCCDRMLDAQARLLVDPGAEFSRLALTVASSSVSRS
jgi:hypothetical protein